MNYQGFCVSVLFHSFIGIQIFYWSHSSNSFTFCACLFLVCVVFFKWLFAAILSLYPAISRLCLNLLQTQQNLAAETASVAKTKMKERSQQVIFSIKNANRLCFRLIRNMWLRFLIIFQTGSYHVRPQGL